MFVEKYLQRKLKKIQERTLRFMLKDQIGTYEQLLEKCNYVTLHIRRL